MTRRHLSIIVAIADANAIGRGGDLLFHISDDLRHFKRLTMGHPIIMGRKTFESFPSGPLPGRRNMVITRNSDYAHEGIETFPSLEAALDATDDAEPFVIGGGEIYRAALQLADRLYVTRIDAHVDDADTFFPEIDRNEWTETSTGDTIVDLKTGVSYRFTCLSRR